MAERLARKVLIVGWDAADWKMIDPLLAAGAMPHLAKLLEGGVRGDLGTLDPKLSPLLWTSVATGKTADKHGILHFVEPDPEKPGLRITASTSRKTKALWNMLTQRGLRTHVVGWYASHPAEPIRGACVSNLFMEGEPASPEAPWPLAPGAVHPQALAAEIALLRLHPAELRPEELLPLVPALYQAHPADPRLAALKQALAKCVSVHNVVTTLLAEDADPEGHGRAGSPGGWDCTMVFYNLLDEAGHHFMQHHPPRMAHVPEREFELFRHVMAGAYQFVDLMLGRLLELAGPETTVILLSDHGFHSDHLRPAVNPQDKPGATDANWHRPLGVLAMSGPGLKKGQRIYGATILDVAPTALTLLGLPVGADMDGRVLVEAFESPPAIERLFSWDFEAGEDGRHPADKRADPFEAHSALQQLVDLGYIAEIPADAAEAVDLATRETRFNLAVVYMTTRRVGEALPIFQELHAAHPEESRYSMNLARCYYGLGCFEEAREVLDRLLREQPDAPDARIILGAALVAERRMEEAGAVLEEAERQTPNRPELSCMLGEAYVFLKRLEDAERVFRRAETLDPTSARAQHGLALVELNRQRFEAAATHALRAVELQHFYPDAHYTLGVALTWMKDYPHAIKSFEVALSMQPGLIEAHRYLASIHRHLGDTTSAPRHRDAAQRLIRDRRRGQTSYEDLNREPPMGPQEWATHIGESRE